MHLTKQQLWAMLSNAYDEGKDYGIRLGERRSKDIAWRYAYDSGYLDGQRNVNQE